MYTGMAGAGLVREFRPRASHVHTWPGPASCRREVHAQHDAACALARVADSRRVSSESGSGIDDSN